MNYTNRLAALGAAIPELLIPKTDLSKWAVIACDQGTQDRPYWEQVRAVVGDAPSSLHVIFPEVYLDDPGREERIAAIKHTMKRYMEEDVFAPPQKALVYVERDTPFHQSQKGLIIALDLEAYDWKTTGKALHPPLIRPTEGTLPERLPARMDVRRDAPLETPHMIVLIDDEENTVIPTLGERAKKNTGSILYDTELMLGSGRVRGWKLDREDDWNYLTERLEKLIGKIYGELTRKADESAGTPFLYAMGDGNHSLAAAKEIWDEYKAAHKNKPNLMNHPARWALVELVNLYDPALAFEPIHRLLFGITPDDVLEAFGELPGYHCRTLDSPDELISLIQDEQCNNLRLGVISQGHYLLVEAEPVSIAIDAVQPLLDKLIDKYNKQNTRISIDYIHGSDNLCQLSNGKRLSNGKQLSNGETVTGILLPPFRKHGLFETIARRGSLPQKSFSLGESAEKRFYLECRKLFC